jgi:hypothetical protein
MPELTPELRNEIDQLVKSKPTGWAREIIVGVIVAAVVAGGGVLWNWSTSGGLIRALHGMTKVEVETLVQDEIKKHPLTPTPIPPSREAGFSLVSAGEVDSNGKKLEHFGPLDFDTTFVSQGHIVVRFIGPAPATPPLILIGSTRGDAGVSTIVTKRARDGFEVSAVFGQNNPLSSSGFWFFAVEPSP